MEAIHLAADHHQETQTEKILKPWEKSCHALIDLLERKQLVALEEKLKKWIELSADQMIRGDAYYEHWILAATQVLLEKDILDEGEINKKVKNIALRSIREIH